MALTRWAPFQGLFDLQRDMDLLMRPFLGTDESGSGTRARAWVPVMDVFHRDGDLVIRAELPGIDPEKDVEISFHDGLLTLRGERRREERLNGNGGGYRFESRYGTFERSVVLPTGVTDEAISASYQNGILEVVVQGVQELARAKRIPVHAGESRKAITTEGRTES